MARMALAQCLVSVLAWVSARSRTDVETSREWWIVSAISSSFCGIHLTLSVALAGGTENLPEYSLQGFLYLRMLPHIGINYLPEPLGAISFPMETSPPVYLPGQESPQATGEQNQRH